MKRIEILYRIDSLIGQHVGENRKALKEAKEAVSKEYKYKFWANLLLIIMAAIMFGSFVAMAYFMYR